MAVKNSLTNQTVTGLRYGCNSDAFPKLSDRYNPISWYISNWEMGKYLRPNQNRWTFYRSRSWVTTPNYKALIAANQPLPENPFSYTETYTVYPQGTWMNRAGGKFNTANVYNGCIVDVLPSRTGTKLTATASEQSAVDRRAITKVLLQAKDQKVNLLQMLGERKQTARLFAETVERLAGAIKGLKTGDYNRFAKALGVLPRKRAKTRYNKAWSNYENSRSKARTRAEKAEAFRRYQKAVAQGWLEGVYGWQPLIGDIRGACEEINRKRQDVIYRMVEAEASLKKETSTKVSTTYESYKTDSESRFMVKYAIYFSVTEPGFHTLSRLGISNLAATAWELVPWSFVVDWLLPVGDWINSWDATVGLQFSHGCKITSLRWQSKVVGNAASNIDRTDVASYYCAWQGSSRGFDLDRGRLNSWPSVQLPSFKNPFSEMHIANALALLRTSFGGWR